MELRRRTYLPIPQCQCPDTNLACTRQADGEDRLCTECRETHDPDGLRRTEVD